MSRTNLLVAIFLLSTSLVLIPAAQSYAARKALLIGIGEYRSEKIPFLRGPQNDLKKLRKVLINEYGFSEGNVHVLKDGQATKEAIRKGIRKWFVDEASPSDTLVFYYGGHGSQVPDTSGDEEDGRDETLVPADTDPSDKANNYGMILDDELGQWFSEVKAREVVIFIDACHSGSITRGFEFLGNQQCRFFDVTGRFSCGAQDRGGEAVSRAIPQPTYDEMDNLIVFSASKAYQLAAEVPFEFNGKEDYYGVFSFFLTDALKSYAEGGRIPTYKQLLDDITMRIKETGLPQDPHFEGSRDLILEEVFGGVEEEKEEYAAGGIRITSISNGIAAINAGWEDKVTVGSVYEIYPSSYKPGQPGTLLGKLTISKISQDRSQGSITLKRGPIEVGNRVVEYAHAYYPKRLRVLVKALQGDDGLIKNGIENELFGKNFIKVVKKPGGSFDKLIKGKVERQGGYEKISIRLIDRYGRIEGSFTGDDVKSIIDEISSALERGYTLKAISGLKNHAPTFKVETWVSEKGKDKFRYDELLTFNFKSEKDAYINLINIASDGTVTVLFPNQFSKENFVKGGKTYTVPSMDDSFEFYVKPPFGVEIVKVIATLYPLDMTMLKGKATYKGGFRTFSTNRGLNEPGPVDYVNEVIYRGIDVREKNKMLIKVRDWSESYITFETRE